MLHTNPAPSSQICPSRNQTQSHNKTEMYTKLAIICLCLLLPALQAVSIQHPAFRGDVPVATDAPCNPEPAMTTFFDTATFRCRKGRQQFIVFFIRVDLGPTCSPIILRKKMPCRRETLSKNRLRFAQRCLKRNMSKCDNVGQDMRISCGQEVINKCCRTSSVAPFSSWGEFRMLDSV